ncbi:hypothetical protein SOVF_077650, partial [Spinacia oleracea]
DRLTSLPDTLLVEILCLLPLKSAAATCVLSRRWRHLWTLLPHLVFDGGDLVDDYWSAESRFIKFNSTVNHILQQLTSPHIHTFDLRISDLGIEEQVCSASLEAWIRLLAARNVATIKVFSDFVWLPTCMFEIQSLVKLQLVGCYDSTLPKIENVKLPNLKNLELIYSQVDPEETLWELIKFCPLLEVLSLLLEYIEVIDISAPNLKSLIIKQIPCGVKLVIDAPMLEHIALDGFLGDYCFVKCLTRLVKADLSIRDFIYSPSGLFRKIPSLLQGISSVKSLQLSNAPSFFTSLNCLYVDVGSIFRNLTHLIMDDCNDERTNVKNPIPVCLLSKLKVIEMLNTKWNADYVNLLDYILSNVNVLKRLYVSSVYDESINYKDDDDPEEQDFKRGQLWWEYELSNTLLMIPKSSLTYEVEFVGNYIRVSSDKSQNGLIRTSCISTWG